MSAPIRKTNLDVTVFSIAGTDYLCDLKNCTLDYQVQTEESKGVCTASSYPWAVGDSWTLQGEIFVNSSASVLTAAFANSLVTIAFNTGGNSYSGSAQVTSVGHAVGASQLQTQSVSMSGFGPLTIS